MDLFQFLCLAIFAGGLALLILSAAIAERS